MQSLLWLTVMSLSALSLNVRVVRSKERHDTTNAFQSFEHFPYGIAMFDEDEDGDFDCLRAKRTKLENDSATYLWFTNGNPPKTITLDIWPGPTNDIVTYEMDNDKGHVHNAHFFYADYNSCLIHDFYHGGKQECVLWVKPDVVENIPQTCTDKYLANCDVKNIVYDKDSCDEFLQSS